MSKHDKKDWNKFKEENQLNEGVMGGDSEDSSEELTHDEAALDHPSYIALEEQLTLAEQKAHEHWEKSVRALAELDNVRRRMEREVANAHRYGAEKLITALLPVADSLEQALQIADKNSDAAMHEGLELNYETLY